MALCQIRLKILVCCLYLVLIQLLLTHVQIPASKNLTSTLKVADSVGGYHLAGIRLEQDETDIIDKIRELVMQEKYEEAEEASKGLLSLWGGIR